ncbi:MAG: SGNH/GDSL hydrolase family protein [Phycisphaerae bacterium]
MQEPGGWELAWNLMIGPVLSADFWPAALLLGMTLLSWPAWLACTGRVDRPALRWSLGAYGYSRLMTDFVFWGPVVAGLAAVLAARGVMGPQPGKAGVKRSAATLAVAIASVVMTLTVPYWPVTQWAVCALLVSRVFGPVAVPGPDSEPTRTGLWRYAWVGLVLSLPVDGLTQRVYLPLVGLGMLGWVAYAFALWRRSAKHTPESVFRRGLGGIAWALAGLLCSLAILEVYFQQIYDASDGNTGLKTSRLWWKRHVAYNPWGFRDREFEPLDRFDDHLRVVILGDSFAFGQGIANTDELLGPFLEKELTKRMPDAKPVTCFNLSKGGIATDRELAIFQRWAPRIGPHAVVWVYMLNDIGEAAVFKAVNHPALNRWRRLTRASVAWDFLVWRVYTRWFMPGKGKPPLEVTYYADADIFARHRRTIDKLVATIADSGCPMVVVVYPYLDMPHDLGIQRDALDAVLSVFQGHGVPVIDTTQLADLTEPGYVVNRFDAHPSAALNRIVAEAIAKALMEQESAWVQP